MKHNIICLKVGTKYSSDYVNKLYNMTQRHTTIPHRFVCFTEDSNGLNPEIEVKPLPNVPKHITGWFYKLAFFQPNLAGLQGTILYFDLDVVIINNIDEMFTYKPGEFCIINDWLYSDILKQKKYNSSIMKWNVGQYSNMFYDFVNNFKYTKKYVGDQDYITDYVQPPALWPKDWCVSFKFSKCYQTFPKDSKVIVFHGKPNPHEASEPGRDWGRGVTSVDWIEKYWY